MFKEHKKIDKSKRYKASKKNQGNVATPSTFETFKPCFSSLFNSEYQFENQRKECKNKGYEL